MTTEWHASEYLRVSALQQAMGAEVLARLALRGDERVLDVGCGDGRITAAIAARVPRGSALGIDPSSDMIAFATEHFGPPANANLRFEVGDARALAYPAEFDQVVSFNALHWVSEQLEALRSIRRAMKLGGRAWLRMVPQGQRLALEDVIESVRRQARWSELFGEYAKPYAHFRPEEYRALAEEAGLQVDEVSVEDGAWDFETREAFVAFARATFVAWTEQLPEGRRDEFIEDVLDQYRSVTADAPKDANVFKYYQMDVVLTGK